MCVNYSNVIETMLRLINNPYPYIDKHYQLIIFKNGDLESHLHRAEHAKQSVHQKYCIDVVDDSYGVLQMQFGGLSEKQVRDFFNKVLASLN